MTKNIKLTKKQILWIEILKCENEMSILWGCKPIYSEEKLVDYAIRHKKYLDHDWTIALLNEGIEWRKRRNEELRASLSR